MKKKAADWAVFSFLKVAQIWSTRPMRYSPVQADQKKPNWAATRPIWQNWLAPLCSGTLGLLIKTNLFCLSLLSLQIIKEHKKQKHFFFRINSCQLQTLVWNMIALFLMSYS